MASPQPHKEEKNERLSKTEKNYPIVCSKEKMDEAT